MLRLTGTAEGQRIQEVPATGPLEGGRGTEVAPVDGQGRGIRVR